ncbi:MAG: putative toxin-antitoxin system toxin component, PIN family [Propionibacteriaceae bacterium]|nr:putative toxin-antitoxin system toxin component, PIN family [Propionibacteriaceae bacterium]
MRVLIDTNILVSAVLFPQGLARKALVDAVESDIDAVVCDYSITELHEVFDRKFPTEVGLLPQFLTYLGSGVTIVSTPGHVEPDEPVLRDPKDQPILSAARAADADLILTGDKDLRDAGLTHPSVTNPRDFLTR